MQSSQHPLLPLSAAIALVATVALTACKSELTRARDSSEELARTLVHTRQSEPQQAPPASKLLPHVVYIDASRSMAGFVGCTARATKFDVVIDRLITELSPSTIVRFGERTKGDANAFESHPVAALGRAVHCSPFYDRAQNPDYQLFHRINADSEPQVSIYVTDGVQSDMTGTNLSPSVREMEQWIRSGNALSALVFRSEFHGPAWSEFRQQMIGTADVPNRPFYAFLFAPTEADIRALYRGLSAETRRDAMLISLSGDSVDCVARLSPKLPKYASARTFPWAMVGRATFERIADRQAVIAEYVCTHPASFPFETVLPRVNRAEYYGWTHGSFARESILPRGANFVTDSVSAAPRMSTAYVKAGFPEDELHRFGFYVVNLAAQPGAVSPGIKSLSTDSDAELASFARTYRFSWLVEQLAQTGFERSLGAASFALTLQYR